MHVCLNISAFVSRSGLNMSMHSWFLNCHVGRWRIDKAMWLLGRKKSNFTLIMWRMGLSLISWLNLFLKKGNKLTNNLIIRSTNHIWQVKDKVCIAHLYIQMYNSTSPSTIQLLINKWSNYFHMEYVYCSFVQF